MKIIVAALALSMMVGCATKTYGRLGPLTAYEQDSMTCREVELDAARTRGFIERVNKESEFSGKDVLAILGDFGIGNSMEKSAALESATTRLSQLESLRPKKCAPGSATATPPTNATASSGSPVGTTYNGCRWVTPTEWKCG